MCGIELVEFVKRPNGDFNLAGEMQERRRIRKRDGRGTGKRIGIEDCLRLIKWPGAVVNLPLVKLPGSVGGVEAVSFGKPLKERGRLGGCSRPVAGDEVSRGLA